MALENRKYKKPLSRLILACFLVLLAIGAGLFTAYYAFSGQANKIVNQKTEVNMHSANPTELSFYENLYKFSEKKIDFTQAPVAGVIPHHLLAGDLIAEFFSNLAGDDYETIILLGPNHFNAGTGKIITSAENWQTPYGILPVDSDALKVLSGNNEATIEENVFDQEHSIYTEVSFIKRTFPRAKFLPLVLRPNLSQAEAQNLAEQLYQISLTKKILVISSTDFSHYKSSAAAQADDARSLAILKNQDFGSVYGMAVDSPPATYVLMKYANLSGANFVELNNSNSALLSGENNLDSTTSYITGYFINNSPLERADIPLPRRGAEPGEAGWVSKSYCAAQTGCVTGFLPTASSSPLKLLFFGDIMLDRYVAEKIKAAGNMDRIFSALADTGIFAGNDIVSANLEGAVTDNGAHLPPVNPIDLAFAPADVGELAKYDFNYFNIANNHLADQGKNGIIETEKNLTALGFDFAGCPDRQVGACTATVVEKNGRKIGLIGASMVYGALDEKALLGEVKELADTTDLVVAQMHWGTEYQRAVNKNQVALAHELIDAGADLVIGTHPHVVGGIEIYKDKPIFYSLGNFIFDQYFSTATQEELGAKIATDGKNFQIDLLPIQSEATKLRLMNDAEKNKFLNELAGWSIGGNDFKKSISQGRLLINK